MKVILIILFVLALGLSGCYASDPFTETLYLADIDSNNITTQNVTAVNVNSDFIMLGGAPLLIPACGEMYITVPIATPLAVAGTYYKALGTTLSGECRGFTDGIGRLTYNDITRDRICLVTGAMSMHSDTVFTVVSVKLYINDLPHDSSLIKTKLLQVGDVDCMTLIALTTLQPSDYIEVWISSDKPTVEITLDGLDFTATTVD